MPAEAKLEKPITRSILKWLNSLPSCKALKMHGSPFSYSGEPDIAGCLDGVAFHIEVKAPGKKPTPLQYQRLAEWKEAGALSFWTTSLEDVQQEFKEHLPLIF